MMIRKLLRRGPDWAPDHLEPDLSDHMALAVTILLPLLFFVLVRTIWR